MPQKILAFCENNAILIYLLVYTSILSDGEKLDKSLLRLFAEKGWVKSVKRDLTYGVLPHMGVSLTQKTISDVFGRANIFS